MALPRGEIGFGQRVAGQRKRSVEGMLADRTPPIVHELRQPIGQAVVEVIDDIVAPSRFSRHVEHKVDPHGRTEKDAAAVRHVGIAGLTVERHDYGPMPSESQRHDPRQRRVDETQPHALA